MGDNPRAGDVYDDMFPPQKSAKPTPIKDILQGYISPTRDPLEYSDVYGIAHRARLAGVPDDELHRLLNLHRNTFWGSIPQVGSVINESGLINSLKQLGINLD
jgi:hypothetical protein